MTILSRSNTLEARLVEYFHPRSHVRYDGSVLGGGSRIENRLGASNPLVDIVTDWSEHTYSSVLYDGHADVGGPSRVIHRTKE